MTAAKAIDNNEVLRKELDQKVQEVYIATLETSSYKAETELLQGIKVKLTKEIFILEKEIKRAKRKAWLNGLWQGSGGTIVIIVAIILL